MSEFPEFLGAGGQESPRDGELRQLVLEWFDLTFSSKNPSSAKHLVSQKFIGYGFGSGDPPPLNKQQMLQFLQSYVAAFPDIRVDISHLVIQGEWVSARWVFTGTHTGTLEGVPPSKRKVRVTGMTIMRWKNMLLVESYVSFDHLGLLRQLGLMDQAT